MLRRKKKEKEVEVKETELPLSSASKDSEEVVEVQAVEVDSTLKNTEVVTETIAPEPVAAEVAEPVVDSSNDALAQLTNTLNSEFKKSGNGLTAQIAKVSNNLTYVLIKAANSAYCFARIGQAPRGGLELEFLSNVPSHAHNQIFEICKSLNISDSKRLFFHPSGIL